MHVHCIVLSKLDDDVDLVSIEDLCWIIFVKLIIPVALCILGYPNTFVQSILKYSSDINI